ncbi:MAG: fasciclin domain-containing protein [Alistipes sp.]|nr:fasciclin domain-containing protein [Alistipes sp.]
MFKHIIHKLLLLLAVAAIAGCDDMKLQTDADYDASVLDPHIDMTAWEYLESRPDIFSKFMAAVEYADMKAYYTQNDRAYTFLVLTDGAVNNFVSALGCTTVEECPVEEVRNLILYHIVDGEYSSYGDLPVEPIFVLTLRRGEEGLMTMLTRKNPWMADAGKVVVNNTGSNGSSPMRLAVSSNIMPTNGVVHVFDNYCYYKK